MADKTTDGHDITEIEELLVKRLATSRGVSVEEVRTSIAGAGGIDSHEGLELILAMEEEYGVNIPDDALSSRVCRSTTELARLIRSQWAR
jgi:acyl carrier protein